LQQAEWIVVAGQDSAALSCGQFQQRGVPSERVDHQVARLGEFFQEGTQELLPPGRMVAQPERVFAKPAVGYERIQHAAVRL
jgi:hypothetical protein